MLYKVTESMIVSIYILSSWIIVQECLTGVLKESQVISTDNLNNTLIPLLFKVFTQNPFLFSELFLWIKEIKKCLNQSDKNSLTTIMWRANAVVTGTICCHTCRITKAWWTLAVIRPVTMYSCVVTVDTVARIAPYFIHTLSLKVTIHWCLLGLILYFYYWW